MFVVLPDALEGLESMVLLIMGGGQIKGLMTMSP
jgi:hypothetical protein